MMTVTILGNNSALPAHERHPTAQVIEIRDQLFLIDCGEGTQMQMQRFHIRRRRINHVFISHLHGDHYFGLIGLISTMGLLGRTTDLYIYGPEPLEDIIRLQLSASCARLPFAIHFTRIRPDESLTLVDHEHYCIRCFPMEHRIPCHGFVFTMKNSGRRLLPEKCREHEIPAAFYNRLKQGEDYLRKDGAVIQNEWVTEAGATPKTYAYCADTRYTEQVLPYITHADLLYHESTYLRDDEAKATARFHSTAEQAAQIALKAGVKRLLLGHYSSRYQELSCFQEEAAAIFPNVLISQEGATYTV